MHLPKVHKSIATIIGWQIVILAAAAAKHWCVDHGHNGGITQEAGNNALLVTL